MYRQTLPTDDLDDKTDICKQGYNVNTCMIIEGKVHNHLFRLRK